MTSTSPSVLSDVKSIRTHSSDICFSCEIAPVKGGSAQCCQGLFQCPWGEMSIREQEREISETPCRGKVVQSRVEFTWCLTKRH